MLRPSSRKQPTKRRQHATLTLRLDKESKASVAEAAHLRGSSMSEYVREVIVVQARNEVLLAHDQIIRLTPEEQLAFWNALNASPELTDAQRDLGAVMRGET